MASNALTFDHLSIRYSASIKGNTVRLPHSIVNTIELGDLKVNDCGFTLFDPIGKNNLMTLGWDGFASQDGQSIEINPLLLDRDVKIVNLSINIYDDTCCAEEVHIEPLTSNDWEVAENNSIYLQDNILNQTRFAELNKKFICYLDNGQSCSFKVVKIVSPSNNDVAKLTNGSLIIVAPLENKQRMNSIRKTFTVTNTQVRRSLFSDCNEISTCCFVNENDLDLVGLVRISIVECPIDKKLSSNYIFATVQKSLSIEKGHIQMPSSVYRFLGIPANNGYRVKIDVIEQTHWYQNFAGQDLSFKVVISEKSLENDIITCIKSLPKNFLVTDEMKIELDGRVSQIHILNSNHRSTIPFVQNCDNMFNRINFEIETVKSLTGNSHHFHQHITNNDLINDTLVSEISDFLIMPVISTNCITLEGQQGSGKTTVLNSISANLVKLTSTHVRYVDCNENISLKDNFKLEDLIPFLSQELSLAYWHFPSVIIFDNAESWFYSTETNNPSNSSSNKNSLSTRMALQLINEINSYSKKNSNILRVVLSCKSQQLLNKLFMTNHFIANNWNLKPPIDVQRVTLMDHFYESLIGDTMETNFSVDFSNMMYETNGYTPQDIKILIERFYVQLQIKYPTINQHSVRQLFDDALQGFTPSSLKGVKLTKDTGIKWDDIGALFDAKRLLLETLEMPTKYSKIFDKCPLRLRSGILLYGYAGCGKTLLASAVAQQCGLNFISVKGPEILNKYIGASEQSVRELFDKAQSVKPCVLFFDEFDSIAPKRGHDSTGVTDRIVNQLLTQMDGAEGLDGVYVLAATSRPDLVDSALLRPGRLDKSILCNIPNLEERSSILKAITDSTGLTKKLQIEKSIDLKHIANLTEGYSGADLQSLCYNAYLKAVHRHLSNKIEQSSQQTNATEHRKQYQIDIINPNATESPKYNKEETLSKLRDRVQNLSLGLSSSSADTNTSKAETSKKTISIKISAQDLQSACEDSKPSISQNEYRKLFSIYSKFKNDREGNMPSGESSKEAGTRTSLM